MNQRLKYKLFPNCYETTVFDVICTAEPCKALCLASLKQSPSGGRQEFPM